MIKKTDFIHDWLRSTDEQRTILARTFKTNKDWQFNPVDSGWKFFLGVLTELVVERYLTNRKSTFKLNDSGYIYQIGDTPVNMKNTCDINLWSLTQERFVNAEIKHTSKALYEFGTFEVPDYLVRTAEREGAEWLFLVDGLKYDSWEGCIDFSHAHLLFYNIRTGKEALLLETNELAKYIKEVLDI